VLLGLILALLLPVLEDAQGLGADSAPVRLIATALTSYCVTVSVGLMLGFAILEEKLTNIHVLLGVSPLRFAEYLGAKLILAVGLALALTIPTVALPLGFDVDWLAVLASVLASVPFAISLGLLVGVLAKDQLGAIAIIKGLLPLWASLPILGFVLPEAWLWTQFPFANHWGVQGLYHALGDGLGVWSHAGLNLATGLPLLLVSAWALRRRLGFA
jgi:ABC-2 type transport system permease protein